MPGEAAGIVPPRRRVATPRVRRVLKNKKQKQRHGLRSAPGARRARKRPRPSGRARRACERRARRALGRVRPRQRALGQRAALAAAPITGGGLARRGRVAAARSTAVPSGSKASRVLLPPSTSGGRSLVASRSAGYVDINWCHAIGAAKISRPVVPTAPSSRSAARAARLAWVRSASGAAPTTPGGGRGPRRGVQKPRSPHGQHTSVHAPATRERAPLRTQKVDERRHVAFQETVLGFARPASGSSRAGRRRRQAPVSTGRPRPSAPLNSATRRSRPR